MRDEYTTNGMVVDIQEMTMGLLRCQYTTLKHVEVGKRRNTQVLGCSIKQCVTVQ
jgi:hypothetical protein